MTNERFSLICTVTMNITNNYTKGSLFLFTCLCSSIQRKPVDDGEIITVDGAVPDVSAVAVDQQTRHVQMALLARCCQHPVEQVHPQTWSWERATAKAVQEQQSVDKGRPGRPGNLLFPVLSVSYNIAKSLTEAPDQR